MLRNLATASAIKAAVFRFGTPAIRFSHLFIGMRILEASARLIESAIFSVTSPRSESAITIPIGPMITSALRQATATGFSPVAAFFAPALIMEAVAVAFVPIAVRFTFGNWDKISFQALKGGRQMKVMELHNVKKIFDDTLLVLKGSESTR